MRSLFAFWGVAGVLFLLSFVGRSATLGSEAIHATLDALVVTMTWRASRLLERRDNNYTYGMHRLEVMYSLLNVMTVILGVVVGVVVSLFFLAFRIVDNPVILIIASGVALVLSLISSTDKGDELRRGISLHAILDSISYAIGLMVGISILAFKLPNLDPLGSMLVLGIILVTSLPNVKENVYTLMERSPIDVSEIESYLRPRFGPVHHVHVWSVCPHMRVATLHVTESPNVTLRDMDMKRGEIEKALREKFSITHVTVQFESASEEEKRTNEKFS